jgi:S1/P1 Nuclease
MRRICSLLLFALLFIGFQVPKEAKAWGKYAHVAICDMAYRNLTETSRTQLKTIFQIGQQGAAANARVYDRFNESCVEEDEVPRRHPKDHFINFTRSTADVVGPSCPTGTPSCIVEAIERDLSVLRNENMTPRKRVSSLMSIGHWVGDIHQPLHISFEDDRGGNLIKARGVCGSTNLHAVWDTCLVDRTLFKAIKTTSCYRNGTWATTTITYRGVDSLRGEQPFPSKPECHIALIGLASAADIRLWRSTAPWEWARESYLITLEKDYDATSGHPRIGYCDWRPSTGDCWFDSTHLGAARAPTKTVDITTEYIDHFGPIAVKRVEMAGYRLAHLINTALDLNYRGS